MLLLTGISDRTRSRGLFVMIVFAIGIVGWSILYAVKPHHVTEGGLRARCELFGYRYREKVQFSLPGLPLQTLPAAASPRPVTPTSL